METSYLAYMIRVNDLVTLTFTLKKAFSDFVAAGGIVFHKHNTSCSMFKHWCDFIPLFQVQSALTSLSDKFDVGRELSRYLS